MAFQKHSIEHIEERLQFIQTVLESDYDQDDGNILNSRMQLIGAYMAEAGKLKADAEYYHKSKLQSEIIKAIKDLIPEYSSGTVQNKLVNSLAAEEAALETFADRVNRSCTHQLDSMRSQLSFIRSLPR